jgi:antitoxin CcdA
MRIKRVDTMNPDPALRLRTSSKKAVNLSIDREWLRLGKELGLNLSNLAEEALAKAVKEQLGRRWLEANAAAIEAYNRRVEDQGVFSDGLRTF